MPLVLEGLPLVALPAAMVGPALLAEWFRRPAAAAAGLGRWRLVAPAGRAEVIAGLILAWGVRGAADLMEMPHPVIQGVMVEQPAVAAAAVRTIGRQMGSLGLLLVEVAAARRLVGRAPRARVPPV